MDRVTVKIIADGIAEERDFHLAPARAERFAARVIKDGGQARIVPFAPSGALLDMIAGVIARTR